MASFIMKQMMGSQLDKVKELTGGDGDKKEGGNDEEDPEVAEARREAEEKRDAKYAKMERQREEVRQTIREKYNIKKKEEAIPLPPPCEGRLTADKKGPIPLPDDDDSFDPVKMATNALNTITDKLPFKLPWK
ncbi:unnamed protein product [Rotaria magnacalcarata]|uniref:Complexin n=1 Tax=Rotaria magnacalcarata TaxID=392030 RepID=A0A816UD86_9BILA|nr:unnamed protein product [Rotaria magnacalcarata]CAF1627329.1 unnamed protein product [Rotaria magnacalcarata]CAF2030681.1 unnamed protein product [Rotaria magnacalcarata]CAF2112226.1 unnamed protein product [Rotaria magnacalcarata]CAF2146406.1 unnamed protein product [Rotaria magnacalcarata]